MASLLSYVFIWWDLVPISPSGKLHPVPIAMLIVTMISTQYTFSIYLRHLDFIGNQSPWFWCIIESGILLWWVSRVEGCMFLKIGKYQEWGWKKNRGGWYTFPHYGEGATSQKFTHSPHLGKKLLSHMDNPPVSRLCLPVLSRTKFLFPMASKRKPLN